MRILAPFLVAFCLMVAPAASVRAQYVMDIVSLIAAIGVADLTEAVDGVNRANRVYIARVTELAGIRINGDRLTRAIERRQRVLDYFRSAIRGGREARRALEIHGEELEDVIYATFTNDLTATLYVDNR